MSGNGAQTSNRISTAAEQAKNFEVSIKPEYLKVQTATNFQMEVPSQVSYKRSAHSDETTCLTFNRDGNILYTGGADGIVKGWEVQTGKDKSTMSLPQKGIITSVASSLSNEYVMAATLN